MYSVLGKLESVVISLPNMQHLFPYRDSIHAATRKYKKKEKLILNIGMNLNGKINFLMILDATYFMYIVVLVIKFVIDFCSIGFEINILRIGHFSKFFYSFSFLICLLLRHSNANEICSSLYMLLYLYSISTYCLFDCI